MAAPGDRAAAAVTLAQEAQLHLDKVMQAEQD
jgi:hypothetical protein